MTITSVYFQVQKSTTIEKVLGSIERKCSLLDMRALDIENYKRFSNAKLCHQRLVG